MRTWAAYGIAAAVGGGAGAYVHRWISDKSSGLDGACLALLGSGMVDIAVTSALLASFGVRPTLVTVGLISLGSTAIKYVGGNADRSPGRQAALEGIGGALVGLLYARGR